MTFSRRSLLTLALFALLAIFAAASARALDVTPYTPIGWLRRRRAGGPS
jgi:hypothetical protein